MVAGIPPDGDGGVLPVNGGNCCDVGPIHAPSELMVTILLPCNALARRTETSFNTGGAFIPTANDAQIFHTFGKLAITSMGVMSCIPDGGGG